MRRIIKSYNKRASRHVLLYICSASLLCLLLTICCRPLNNTKASEVIDEVSIKVGVACTISATGSGIYAATINPGNSLELSGNPISVVCNDNSGYDLYAIGFSGDSYDANNTDLQTTLGTQYYIHTSVSGSDSYWSMKITPSGTNTPIVDNSFDSHQTIPSVYTKIAHFDGVATDSVITPNYNIYIASAQPAGDYKGKVKYTIVHPNDAEPPSSVVMQNLPSSKCTSSPIKVIDIRDDNEYHIQRFADGNCWMLDNLSLDLTDQNVQANLTQDTTNASNLSLEYLIGEKTGGIDDQYATTAVSTVWNNKNNQSFIYNYSYSDPRIYTNDGTKTDNDSSWQYGVYYNYCAATAGSYCYGDGANKGTSVNNASEDICPSGWRLPTGGPNGEFNASVIDVDNYRVSMHLPYSGSVIEGSPALQGDNGSWWASTRDNDNKMNRLYIGSWEIYSNSTYQRSNGASIRCILDT